jgi:hypothetical protein
MIFKFFVVLAVVLFPKAVVGRLRNTRNMNNHDAVEYGKICGDTFCNTEDGEYCCDSICGGTCSKFGECDTNSLCNNDENIRTDTPSDLLTDDKFCGTTVCGDNEYCCNMSCSICVPEGETCVEKFCGDDNGRVHNSDDTQSPTRENVENQQCGDDHVCEADEYCCNPSCGICATKGGICWDMFCDERGKDTLSSDSPSNTASDSPSSTASDSPSRTASDSPSSILTNGWTMCGSNSCTDDEFCCNESCSICSSIGGSCNTNVCDMQGELSDVPTAVPTSNDASYYGW